jgi:hypothetical protein
MSSSIVVLWYGWRRGSTLGWRLETAALRVGFKSVANEVNHVGPAEARKPDHPIFPLPVSAERQTIVL